MRTAKRRRLQKTFLKLAPSDMYGGSALDTRYMEPGWRTGIRTYGAWLNFSKKLFQNLKVSELFCEFFSKKNNDMYGGSLGICTALGIRLEI